MRERSSPLPLGKVEGVRLVEKANKDQDYSNCVLETGFWELIISLGVT